MVRLARMVVPGLPHHVAKRGNGCEREQSKECTVTVMNAWVVERFFAWINRSRRLAKDFEATIASAEAFLYAASVMMLTRRLARAS